jgi:hypothetical protein
MSGRDWPLSTRHQRPPSAAVIRIAARWRSTSAARAAASGSVKSGEWQSIGIARPRPSMSARSAASSSADRPATSGENSSTPSTSSCSAASSIHASTDIVRSSSAGR